MRTAFRTTALLLAVLTVAVLYWPKRTQAADQTVGVVLFYATSPLTTYSGVVPEEYASVRLSARLAAVAAGRVSIVPRDQIRAQELTLRWQEADVLRFARLGELARAAGASRLVVGWIRQFVIDHLGGGRGNLSVGGGEGGGLTVGETVVTVQVFDAAQGRIVYQTEVTGHGMGAITLDVVQDMLDNAATRAATELVGPLTAPSAARAP